MIIASNNKNKIIQFKEILPEFNLTCMEENGINIDIEETGETSIENSLLKAKTIYALTRNSVIADDSGLYIDLYDGWPGVKTHRFLENSTAKQRNEYILKKMKDVGYINRSCKSICAISLVDKDGNEYIFVGELNGHISNEICGENSFGYDDIFELSDGRTMAQLTNDEKYKLSARAMALNKLRDFLRSHPNINV